MTDALYREEGLMYTGCVLKSQHGGMGWRQARSGQAIRMDPNDLVIERVLLELMQQAGPHAELVVLQVGDALQTPSPGRPACSRLFSRRKGNRREMRARRANRASWTWPPQAATIKNALFSCILRTPRIRE